jgi:putative ABC transport system substrate-binding protein
VIGFLHSGSAEGHAPFVAGFREGLADEGFVEGGNLLIEYRWADGEYDRLPALAAELVEMRVGAIAALGATPPARAAQRATGTIPIVFSTGAVSRPV